MSKTIDELLTSYESKPTEDRLRALVECYQQAEDATQAAFFEGRMIEATIGLTEHPDWFEHGCLCATCQEYGADFS